MSYLDVGDGHQLYYQLQGELTSAQPILFVHGGPGAGVCDEDKALFAGLNRAVIYVDQRGCGNSRFTQRLNANTTEQLINDIEQLRCALGIRQWILVGGSWGSTLSLLYALRYPDKVTRMLLWGIFLCRQQELDWFYLDGANHIYPDEYQRFMQQVNFATDPVAAYYQQLCSNDRQLQQAAAISWTRWEAVNSLLTADEAAITRFTCSANSQAMALLESYYFSQQGFLAPDYILRHCDQLQTIPLDIVHGRYDTICPLASAWQLASKLPQSRLHISPLAGHGANEQQNFTALRRLLTQLDSTA
ncbi:MAG: prolyl aminopeptidase [Rheinheimera sp.]|nr:prolyl aminopeptidase [Rheinheimera sp.]